MFSPDLPRPLISLLFAVAFLAGCAAQPPKQVADHTAEIVVDAAVTEWLNLQQQVTEMDTTEVSAKLATINKSASTDQLYYFAVLNQQLKTFGAWTVARDAFLALQGDETLPNEQRQLAGILRQYNQDRINAYVKQRGLLDERSQLQQELSQSEEEKQQLAQKIQALTELETAISTRREE